MWSLNLASGNVFDQPRSSVNKWSQCDPRSNLRSDPRSSWLLTLGLIAITHTLYTIETAFQQNGGQSKLKLRFKLYKSSWRSSSVKLVNLIHGKIERRRNRSDLNRTSSCPLPLVHCCTLSLCYLDGEKPKYQYRDHLVEQLTTLPLAELGREWQRYILI